MKKLGAIVAVCCTVFLISLIVAVPKSGTVYVELGNAVSDNPGDYLFGYGFMMDKAAVDVSGVKADEVGTYEAYADYLFWHYPIAVEVRDTTAPVITPLEGTVYLAADREYTPADFVSGIDDFSDGVRSTVTYNGEVYESIRFDDTGDYTAVIRAADVWGNESSRKVAFTVDEAPMIIGAFDRHIVVGADFDPNRVVAADSTDGILTDRIQVDAGGFNPNAAGDYPITYTVSDNYGLETSATVTVSVRSARELRGFRDNLTLTAPELDLLCCLGYFTYEPLDEENYDKTLELIEPTLVDLKRTWSDGSWESGSGVIYEITPEYVRFLSVEHVVKDIGKDCRLMFFDGTAVSEKFDYVTSEEKNEAAIFDIDTADIPANTLLALRQIAVDPDIYNELQEGDSVVAYAKHWNGTGQDKIRSMKIRALRASIKDFDFIDSLVETTQGVVGGMSGTALTDYRGRLVGLASASGPSTTGHSGDSAFHSRIDVIGKMEEKLKES